MITKSNQRSKNFEFLSVGLTAIMYMVIFGTAAVSKLTSEGVPPWFKVQFEKTLLNSFSGALAIQYYLIAALEASVCLGLLASMIKREYRPGAERTLMKSSLIGACLIFVMLTFGLRITNDFATASQSYLYFLGTLLIIERL